MNNYLILANNMTDDSNDYVTTLTAKSIDELNEKYGLKLVESDGKYISGLSKKEIFTFLQKYKIAPINISDYDDICLIVFAVI